MQINLDFTASILFGERNCYNFPYPYIVHISHEIPHLFGKLNNLPKYRSSVDQKHQLNFIDT